MFWPELKVLSHRKCAIWQNVFMTDKPLELIQFSPLTQWLIGSSGGHEGWLSQDPLPVFSAGLGGPREQFWHGQGCPLFDVLHPAFPLSPTPKRALRTVSERLSWHVTCPKHASLSTDSCQKRFPWTHKEVDLSLHPVIDLELQGGETEKLLHALLCSQM